MAENWTALTIGIAVLMVVTGSANTLAAKWADRMHAVHCTGVSGHCDTLTQSYKFVHPFLQAVAMFIGEFLCLPVFFVGLWYKKYQRRRDGIDESVGFRRFNPLVFLPASLCDMCATSVMYVGLNLTNAGSFQMLRGSVIIFTGFLSVAFLRARLFAFKWYGMVFVTLGLVIVGLADILYPDSTAKKPDRNGVIAGDLMIIAAQVIVSVQMVYEQNVLSKYEVPPLLAVGLEGFFGMTFLGLLLVPFYYLHVNNPFDSSGSRGVLEDALFAFKQIDANPMIAVALCGTIFSIAFFNFAGLSITTHLSATTRMVLDSVRTFVIWGFSMALFHQSFKYQQLIGFVVLLYGMMVYNDVFVGPSACAAFFNRFPLPRLSRCCLWFYGPAISDSQDHRALLDSEDSEEEEVEPLSIVRSGSYGAIQERGDPIA